LLSTEILTWSSTSINKSYFQRIKNLSLLCVASLADFTSFSLHIKRRATQNAWSMAEHCQANQQRCCLVPNSVT